MSEFPQHIVVARDTLIARISESASNALKQLLEEKHLYQKVSFAADVITKQVRETTMDARLISIKPSNPC